jgi:hypothetical protein
MEPAALDAAKAEIKQCIADFQGSLPPPFVAEFLLQQWSRYLTLLNARHGSGSPEARAALATAERLIGSVAPKATDRDRADLMRSIGELVRRIKDGVRAAECDRDAVHAFMKKLQETHLQLLQPGTPAPAPSGPETEFNPDETLSFSQIDPRYQDMLAQLRGGDVEVIDMDEKKRSF